MPQKQIKLLPEHRQIMVKHVEAQAPLEACGIVAGKDGQSEHVFLIENILASPVRYQMAPEAQIEAMLMIEEKGWELLAIFHSHPAGPAFPSAIDIAEAAYSEAVYLIFYKDDTSWTCRGFIINGAQIDAVQIK